jgi:hypothetical protein
VRLSFKVLPLLLGVGLILTQLDVAFAQNSTVAASYAPPVTFTAEQDQQNMMEQLGIKALRAGPSGDESTPNHARLNPRRLRCNACSKMADAEKAQGKCECGAVLPALPAYW